MSRVLLVDDDQDILELMRVTFERAGFAVDTAATGAEGLNQARQRLPDAIVLDLLLPDVDGLTVCEILRKEPATASVPLLMLTGVVGQISRFNGLEAGADEYLTKPILPKDLVNRINGLLERKSGKRAQ